MGEPPASTPDSRRLLAGRLSVAFASLLASIGVLRFISDTWHEFNHDYWRIVEGTPLRYVVRAPSDGSWAGYLNAQWFKLLSIPSGIAALWLLVRFGSGTWEHKREEWNDRVIRAVWIGCFLAGFTLIELEKQFHMLEMATVLLDGEIAWVNHIAHLSSATLAWAMAEWLEFEPILRADIELELELERLTMEAKGRWSALVGERGSSGSDRC